MNLKEFIDTAICPNCKSQLNKHNADNYYFCKCEGDCFSWVKQSSHYKQIVFYYGEDFSMMITSSDYNDFDNFDLNFYYKQGYWTTFKMHGDIPDFLSLSANEIIKTVERLIVFS